MNLELSLSVGGKPLEKNLLRLTLAEEIAEIPYIQTFHEYHEDEAGSFKVGAELKCKVKGAEGAVEFTGQVTRVALTRAGGEALLRVTAHDKAHVLTLAHSHSLFSDKSDADICKGILSAHGLSGDIPSIEPKHEQIQQSQGTDWDFLLSRLWAAGLAPIIDKGKVKAVKVDSLGSGSALKIDGKTVLGLEAENDGLAATLQKQLPAASDGLKWRLKEGALRGRARLDGLVPADLGQKVEFENCGPLAGGPSLVWASRLEITGSECTTELYFGCDFLENLHKKHGLADPLEGEKPELVGLYPAKVIELEDPEKEGRIKVNIPLLHKDKESVLARPAQVYAGPDRAVLFRPEVDDEVLVGFMGADPGAPVILGALPSKKRAAPKVLAADDKKNNIKGWVSREGLSLLLDEDKKSITLQTPGGQSLEINDKDAALILKDKNNNSITLDKNGIKLKSGKDIVLEATGNINIKATQKLAGEGLECQLTGKTSMKLAANGTGELSASGPLTIKGAIVKIN